MGEEIKGKEKTFLKEQLCNFIVTKGFFIFFPYVKMTFLIHFPGKSKKNVFFLCLWNFQMAIMLVWGWQWRWGKIKKILSSADVKFLDIPNRPNETKNINIYKIFLNILRILCKYFLKQETIKIFQNIFKILKNICKIFQKYWKIFLKHSKTAKYF